MNIKLATKEFSDALQIGGLYASGGIKRVLPITECVKIDIKDGVLRIFSTDSESSISKRYGEVECEDFSFCVQCKDIIEYVRMIDSSHLSIEINDECNQAIISHDNGNMKLPMYNTNEYPSTPFVSKEDESVTIDANNLKTWIKVGDPFLVQDPMKPQNESLYFDFKDGEMSFCAGSDSGIISGSFKSDLDLTDLTVIINKANFRNIINAIGESYFVRMWNKNNHIMFAANGVLISVRKMDIKYYNFRAVVKPCINNNNIKVVFDRQEMINAIKRIMVTRDIYNSIRLEVKNNSITLISNNLDTSKDASETLQCESNEDITIQFSGEKLIKTLYCFRSDSIVSSFKNFSSPFLISSESEYYSALLMPLMLNNN